jgi:hypothetical protein
MTDLSLIAEQEWNEARRRAVVLRPLVEFKHCPRNKAHEAAVELGLSGRQVYRGYANPAANSLPYCRAVPMAGAENSDWPHHARNCSIA